ncbi:hypothetical protein JB92DRAFT_3025887 [Gautieria morchelliformis]|nr:hypothetical protein JB92DRAFT_3025887 [Gautieria morchelliformis]
MPLFLDLPVELLPVILRHIVKPHHLTLCCLVNKAFSVFTIPQLYERIHIYAWYKHGKAKVFNLFRTLAERPDLAKWVKKLELRDFPKAIYSAESYESLTSSCLKGLTNCTTLHSCTWTRDQTLSTEILEVLSSKCSSLKELEINGHATGTYNPRVLLQFTSLTKISLVMPSIDVIDILPIWLQRTGESLTAFHVLCKETTLITDSTLETLGHFMTQLKHLHIAGCPKVTQNGILSVLRHNSQRIESLGLEGLSPGLDIAVIAENARPFTALTSLTLTLRPRLPPSWSSEFRSLTARSPLAELHLYVIGQGYTPEACDQSGLVDSVVELHALTLRKFSFHRLRLRPELIGSICGSCPNLESLFVVVNNSSLNGLVPALARSRSPSEVLSIATQLGSQVRQLGFGNRVYQLDRITRTNEDKEIIVDLVLTPYEHPEVPEQFLVVRT